MATKASSEMSDALWQQTQEEHEETIRIIDLKYVGVTLVEQDYLRQQENEKIDAFIQRISKLN
jgi:lipoate synthase